MDKLTFAHLVSWITARGGGGISPSDLEALDDICTPAPAQVGATVHALMRALEQRRKLDAIKAHRTLTGVGLKESKDAVEAVMSAYHPAC